MSKSMMNEHKSAFRQIMKGTAIFGGTQMINMLTNIARGKLVAMILGSFGMGISTMLQSAIQPVIQFFSMGLPAASVSSISNELDAEKRQHKIIAFRRCLTFLAIMGCIFMVFSSSMFAYWTSGIDNNYLPINKQYSSWFIALSSVVLFTILSSGENAILQSRRELKRLAKCNIVAPLLGLCLGVPIYYFMGIDGIVPAMILLSFLTWAYVRWNTYRVDKREALSTRRQSLSETMDYGKEMVLLGFTMMVAGLLGNIVVYLTNTFINKNGGAYDVGFYQAANTITSQCTAMVFTALATDYYPHLSELSSKTKEMFRFINQEAEIVILITAPIAALLILFAPLAVRILLTSEFDRIIPIVQMMSITFLMRAFYFPLDYICLAKKDKVYYFGMEGIWTNVKSLVIFVGGYWLFGLIGLGYAAVVNGILDIIVSTILVKWRYGFLYGWQTISLSCVALFATTAVLMVCLFVEDVTISYSIGIPLCLAIIVFSVSELNKRIHIVDVIRRRFDKSYK